MNGLLVTSCTVGTAEAALQAAEAAAVAAYRRRPRRPPFLRVLSVGIGVTSSE